MLKMADQFGRDRESQVTEAGIDCDLEMNFHKTNCQAHLLNNLATRCDKVSEHKEQSFSC